MRPDNELLRRYAQTHSEDAFAELVRRHVNLVYSAALRQVNGDAHLARDVAQTVFADLARKADSLARRESLTGWLYTSTRFAAAKIARTEDRRRQREDKFMRELISETAPEADWEKIRPALDNVMHELKETDREAILLRYFEYRQFVEVGARLGLSENAARMRVERALEKLHAIFAGRGIATTAALASVISANAVQLAPANLAATLATTSFAAAGTGTFTLLKIMTATQFKFSIGALVMSGAITAFVIQHKAQDKLRVENESLHQQITQLQSDNLSLSRREAVAKLMLRLPAPQMQMATAAAALPTADLQSTNLWGRLKDKPPKLTREQVESYLKANGRSAANLLAAFRTSGDPALLKEAMQEYPNDPQVAFEAVFDKDLSPEKQRQWLNTFEKAAPGNALANYLSSLNYFSSGQMDQGVQELAAASDKPMDDYTVSRIQDDVEAYLASGYSLAEAKQMAAMQLMLPQLAQFKQLGLDTVDLANAYRQAGDAASAQAALQLAANLGQRYANQSPGEAEISQLVGIFIERNALQAMNPTGPYGGNGQTVQDRLNQLAGEKTALTELDQQATALFPVLSDQDWIIYKDRWLMFGEDNALRWVISKHGQH
jgi:RNA polymerase sigma factor (sigma-70 family)